jgi:folate-binding Fe-S cluster repair protein YgfZ
MELTTLRVAARPRDFVAVRGADAASYVQAMVSNDVEALAPGRRARLFS